MGPGKSLNFFPNIYGISASSKLACHGDRPGEQKLSSRVSNSQVNPKLKKITDYEDIGVRKDKSIRDRRQQNHGTSKHEEWSYEFHHLKGCAIIDTKLHKLTPALSSRG